jgi:diguanylate cyclase (GGDEF)-like protein
MSFVREFPQIANKLGSEVDPRELPGLLLHITVRCFNPWQAVVLLRRQRSKTDPTRSQHLVVAAVARSGQGVDLGHEIQFGQGLVGTAAEVQHVMTKQDVERDASLASSRRDPDNPLLKLDADLVAPMVFRGETVGVIALSETARISEAAKGMLRVICQMGALAVYNASAYSEMKITAQMDGLTRLYNKTHITLILAEQIYEAEARQAPLSIFMFDIDHFKNYNDTNGHDAGDQLLKELSKLAQENVRRSDYVGRFGGEEFLLVLPNTNKRQAQIVAEKVRERIADYSFPFGKNQPLGRLSVSGGVASYPADGLDTTSLIRAADGALYQSKREGRNRTTLAPPQHMGSDDSLEYDRSILERALEDETESSVGSVKAAKHS